MEVQDTVSGGQEYKRKWTWFDISVTIFIVLVIIAIIVYIIITFAYPKTTGFSSEAGGMRRLVAAETIGTDIADQFKAWNNSSSSATMKNQIRDDRFTNLNKYNPGMTTVYDTLIPAKYNPGMTTVYDTLKNKSAGMATVYDTMKNKASNGVASVYDTFKAWNTGSASATLKNVVRDDRFSLDTADKMSGIDPVGGAIARYTTRNDQWSDQTAYSNAISPQIRDDRFTGCQKKAFTVTPASRISISYEDEGRRNMYRKANFNPDVQNFSGAPQTSDDLLRRSLGNKEYANTKIGHKEFSDSVTYQSPIALSINDANLNAWHFAGLNLGRMKNCLTEGAKCGILGEDYQPVGATHLQVQDDIHKA